MKRLDALCVLLCAASQSFTRIKPSEINILKSAVIKVLLTGKAQPAAYFLVKLSSVSTTGRTGGLDCCNGCMAEMHMEVRISRVQMQVLVLQNALNIVSDALEVEKCNWRHCVCHGESIG